MISASSKLPSVPGYEVLGLLGFGGMGVVYKARQLSENRLVGLKFVLASDEASVQELARFRVEAEAIACLAHPNIVLIHDVGVHDGFPFMAIEYAAKGSVRGRLKESTPPDPRWSIQTLKPVADALHHAHERSILHRDLKPDNILLDENDAPKVTDFGLAKFTNPIGQVVNLYETFPVPKLEPPGYSVAHEGRTHSELAAEVRGSIPEEVMLRMEDVHMETEDVVEYVLNATRQSQKQRSSPEFKWYSNLTPAFGVMGTPSYMAPEQILGDIDAIGPHTDIYAMGATLYEMLAGFPPFQGAYLDKLREQILHATPSPFAVPELVDAQSICLKCLEKNPDDRYENAQSLANDLNRFLDGKPVDAPRKLPAVYRRPRKPVAASAATIAATKRTPSLAVRIVRRLGALALDLVVRVFTGALLLGFIYFLFGIPIALVAQKWEALYLAPIMGAFLGVIFACADAVLVWIGASAGFFNTQRFR